METNDLLADAFSHIHRIVHASGEGLTQDQLAYRPEQSANSIAWLIWHLTRIQDAHLAPATGLDEAWFEHGWDDRFGMPGDHSVGYGDGPVQVAALRPDTPELLLGYHDSVFERTCSYLDAIDADELDRVVDMSYDPPVTAGVRLVSVISDNLQHAGQARYLRGIIDRVA